MSASISTPVGPVVAAVARDADAVRDDLRLHVDMGERQRVAHGDQFRGALGGLDAGEARDLERIAFGVCGQRREHGGGEFDERRGGGGAPRGLLGADIDHAGLAAAS